jgi:hypothetical protein
VVFLWVYEATRYAYIYIRTYSTVSDLVGVRVVVDVAVGVGTNVLINSFLF